MEETGRNMAAEARKKMRASLLLAAFLLATGAGFTAVKVRTDGVVRQKIPGSSIIYVPSGKFLKYATLGYNSLAADLVYIWSIQFYGDTRIADRFDYLDHIYGIIAELDPPYIDPYEIGALIAVHEARDVSLAYRILDRGMDKNPDNWVIPLLAGHIAQMTVKDFETARRYFAAAMDLPGSPDFVRRLHANAIFRVSDYRTAWETWLDIYRTAGEDRVRRIATNHLYQVKTAIDTEALKKVIAAYRESRGRNPASLQALVAAGMLREVPMDFDGNPYLYDPETGDVKAAASPWKR